MKCIWCGKGEGREQTKGYSYICTSCVNELDEFAELGKAFFKEFNKKGTISKEFIESKIQNLIDWQRKWTTINDIVNKLTP